MVKIFYTYKFTRVPIPSGIKKVKVVSETVLCSLKILYARTLIIHDTYDMKYIITRLLRMYSVGTHIIGTGTFKQLMNSKET